jgi:hypothetical protein
MRALLSRGYRAGVHNDVPLPWVHVRRPWWRTSTVVGGGAIGSRGGVARGVATMVSIVVVIPAAITIVMAAVVFVPVVVVIAVARATIVGLARRARHQGWRQRSGQHVVAVEHCRSNSRTRGVQVNFLQ